MLRTMRFGVVAFVACIGMARAQKDQFGVVDTVSVAVEKGKGEGNWVATVALANDEKLQGLTVPLKYPEGCKVDSVSFADTRLVSFWMKVGNTNTSVQNAVLLFGIATADQKKQYLEPGRGPIARIYFSAPRELAMTAASLDTTRLPLHNVLQLVTPDSKSIYPAFVNGAAVSAPAVVPAAASTDTAAAKKAPAKTATPTKSKKKK